MSWGAEKHQLLVVYPDIPESSKSDFRLKTAQSFHENSLLSGISLKSIKILKSEQMPNKELVTMALLIETDMKCDQNILMKALSQSWPKVVVIDAEYSSK
jgi:hypothetical protein